MDHSVTLLSRYTERAARFVCHSHRRCDVQSLSLTRELGSLQLCLQIFQLLSSEVAPLVWDEAHSSSAVQKILQALMDIILGQVSHFTKDTCLFSCYLYLTGLFFNQSVSCLAVLQQGHSSFGRHCRGHADQHSIREQSWRSCCLGSATGLRPR